MLFMCVQPAFKSIGFYSGGGESMAENKIFEKSGKVTWGDFKKLIEEAGVKDCDEIDRIDVSWGNIKELKIIHDDDFGWQVFL